MKYFLFFFWLSAAPALLGAQTGPDHSLSLAFGPGHLARQDRIFSPLVHRDFSPLQFRITYAAYRRLYQSISLGYASFAASPRAPFGYFEGGERKVAAPHAFNLVDLEYRLGIRRVGSSGEMLRAGLRLSQEVQLADYVYARTGNLGYWSGTGLGLFLDGEWPAGPRGALSAGLALPVIQWVARSPYLVNDEEYIENIASHSAVGSFFAFVADGRWAGPGRVQSGKVTLAYHHDPGRRWTFGLGYAGSFLHVADPRPFLSLRHDFSFLTTIKF